MTSDDEITLSRDLDREQRVREMLEREFYDGSWWLRLKRHLGLKTYPPLRNITIWNVSRHGAHLFSAVDVNDGYNDRFTVETNWVGEPVRFVDQKRRSQIVEFPDGSMSTFCSSRALMNFCSDATKFIHISKHEIDRWNAQYEYDLAHISRAERLTRLAKEIYAEWLGASREFLTPSIPRSMNDGPIQTLSVKALLTVLLVITHNDYGEANELSKRELKIIMETMASRDERLSFHRTCLEYMREINGRADRQPYTDFLVSWLRRKKLIVDEDNPGYLTQSGTEVVLSASRRVINVGLNFEWRP